MKLQPYEQALIDGDKHALREFGRCKHCVVVDWRDGAEEILRGVKRMLPDGYLEYRRIDEQTWELLFPDAVHKLATTDGAGSERLVQSINRALLPAYEMRIFKPTMGDGYSLLVRPAEWWSEFSAAHGARACKLFVTTGERVAATETDPTAERLWKSWWRKLNGD